ncbi:hypothetical protein Q3G72_016417 [Acer saccharum]|nr:hypothetical protein Q3G72_016417 [Acer saccharum]
MVHLLSGISSRMFLAEGFAQGFSKVEKLDIVAYDGPTSFLKSGNYSLLEFKTSMKLYFKIGPRLSSLGEEMLQQQELPGRCQYLILEDCQDPVKLEQALQSLSFLRGISITCSKEIKFFPETGLPSQLRFIDIDKCDALHCLEKSLACMFFSKWILLVIYWIGRVPSHRDDTTEYALKNCALCVHINDGCEICVFLVQGVYKSSCHDGLMLIQTTGDDTHFNS